MFAKLKKKHDSIELDDLNNIILIVSLIVLLISLVYVSNIFILSIIYIFIYELSSHIINNKYIRFLSNFLGIFLLAYILIHFLSLSFLEFNIKVVISNFIKVLLFTNYFIIVFINIRMKKLKVIKNNNKKRKNYTFKELRKEKIKYFQDENNKLINDYIKENNINKSSDYYKIINENKNNKSMNDLEEYVWINYLRFYKNRKYNKRNVFDKMNFIFILIHVIILILSIFVR